MNMVNTGFFLALNFFSMHALALTCEPTASNSRRVFIEVTREKQDSNFNFVAVREANRLLTYRYLAWKKFGHSYDGHEFEELVSGKEFELVKHYNYSQCLSSYDCPSIKWHLKSSSLLINYMEMSCIET